MWMRRMSGKYDAIASGSRNVHRHARAQGIRELFQESPGLEEETLQNACQV
jgi:hypothetical protein